MLVVVKYCWFKEFPLTASVNYTFPVSTPNLQNYTSLIEYMSRCSPFCIIFKKPIDYPSSEVFRCSKVLSIDQMYQLKILMSAHSLFYSPQLIPFTLTLLEALCSISLLPSLRPLLSKYALLISYHFYGTIYLLILNKFLIHLNLKHL